VLGCWPVDLIRVIVPGSIANVPPLTIRRTCRQSSLGSRSALLQRGWCSLGGRFYSQLPRCLTGLGLKVVDNCVIVFKLANSIPKLGVFSV
jgi:hypothetical protein